MRIPPYVREDDEQGKAINTILNYFQYLTPMGELYGQVEPPADFKLDGLVAYADGTNWDPLLTGNKGYYRWDATTVAWVYIG